MIHQKSKSIRKKLQTDHYFFRVMTCAISMIIAVSVLVITDINATEAPLQGRNGTEPENTNTANASQKLMDGYFIRGDVNASGFVDNQDLVDYSAYINLGTPLACIAASDVNADGVALAVSDYIYLITYLNSGGSPPGGNFPDCDSEPGYPNCLTDCGMIILSFPNNGGVWPIGTEQIVTWSLLSLNQADVVSYDISLDSAQPGTVYLFTGLPNTTNTITFTVPFMTDTYYWVRVTAHLVNGGEFSDVSNLPIYVTSDQAAIGIAKSNVQDFYYKELNDCLPPMSFTGTNYWYGPFDVDMTVTPNGDYILTARGGFPGFDGRLERIDLTAPGLPVDIITNPTPVAVWRGVDPVSVPFSNLMLYACDANYYLFDLAQSPPLLSSTTGNVNIFAEGFRDIDPTISSDGKKAVLPGIGGYEILDLSNTSAIVSYPLTIATGAFHAVDAVITPDNGTAIHIAQSQTGYNIIDISDPTNPVLTWVGGNPIDVDQTDIDIVIRNSGDRFIYPADYGSSQGYDIVDISDRLNPVRIQAIGNPNVREAIDPIITGNGRYCLYPAIIGSLRGYDRIDMETGAVVFIPGNPLAYDGFDIVITPNDSVAIYQAYKTTPLGGGQFLIEEGYDIIDIENAVVSRFVVGKPSFYAHRDIQITPDGTRAIYPRGPGGFYIDGYDLIELNNPLQTTTIDIPLPPNFVFAAHMDNDIIISPDSRHAIHAGHAVSGSSGVIGYVCINLESPYSADPPTNQNHGKNTGVDGLINLTSTTAEGVDQDSWLRVGSVEYPDPEEYDDYPPDIVLDIYPGSPPPTWNWGDGKKDPLASVGQPEMVFSMKNDDDQSITMSFIVYYVNRSGDSTIWYWEPESFSALVPGQDSILISCQPPLPEGLPLGTNYMLIEMYVGDTTGTANNRLVSEFNLYPAGDANGDYSVNLGDAGFVINYIFYSGAAPDPLELGDANCDGSVNLADAGYVINYIFYEGPQPGCY